MITFINPRAAAGRAMEKWQKILPALADTGTPSAIHTMNGKVDTEHVLVEALNAGETEFVAAGGDGTVNCLLNLLITHAAPEKRAGLTLGAIGLGSSNDFHKPVPPTTLIPTRIDFASSRLRDVGKITYWEDGLPHTRYFLTNASIGVTASANHLFNTPGAVLNTLKVLSTPSAIMYAAVRAIVQHRSIPVHLLMPSGASCAVNLSNLAILKNPHVSGNLRFPVDRDYENGRFSVCLFHNMTRSDLLHALNRLRSGGVSGRDTVLMWEAPSLSVSAADRFPVEFDGEVVMATNVRFEVLPRHLKVCTC